MGPQCLRENNELFFIQDEQKELGLHRAAHSPSDAIRRHSGRCLQEEGAAVVRAVSVAEDKGNVELYRKSHC